MRRGSGVVRRIVEARATRPSWPGYEPWAATVVACRREFVGLCRSVWLIPEIFPPTTRDDIALLHAVCRQLDDAVDDAADPEAARAALERWRRELSGDAPPRALVAAFLAGARRSGLPLDCFAALLDGMESDLEPVRIADDDALLRYAYQVSASVSLMMAYLMQWRGREADRRVVDLGLALQLSNILLGVAADARRGRVYLPTPRLAAVGLTPEDVLRQPDDPRLQPVLAGVAALADRYYASAAPGVLLAPLRYRHGILLFAQVYADLGRRVSRGAPPPHTFTDIPISLKLRGLGNLLVTACQPPLLGLAPLPHHDAVLHRPIAGWPGTHTPESAGA